jgi:hypothetical protein
MILSEMGESRGELMEASARLAENDMISGYCRLSPTVILANERQSALISARVLDH